MLWAKAIKSLTGEFPLSILLEIAGMKRSTYYWALKHEKDDPDAEIRKKIVEIFKDSKKRYGVKRVTDELRNPESKYKMKVNHKKVQRIMHEMGLRVNRKKSAKYSSYKGEVGKTAPNIIGRDFTANGPNQKWGTDVTEFHIPKWGKLYLSPIIDFYDGSVVAYDISRHPDFAQTDRMLDMAFGKQKKTAGIILHSDQGWQYQMKQYQSRLEENGIIQSMSRKGTCLDNAMTENFFGRLKVEMFYGHEQEFDTYEKLKQAIEEYIVWYNSERIKLRLKMSPEQFRRHSSSEFDVQ